MLATKESVDAGPGPAASRSPAADAAALGDEQPKTPRTNGRAACATVRRDRN